MKLIKPKYKIVHIQSDALKLIENAGRLCYKSEGRITEDSAEMFVKKIIKSGHYSVIEHANITIKFICDRGVSHELVRHRLATYSQESTRYCNYKGGVTFILPSWYKDLGVSEYTYKDLDSSSIKGASLVWLEALLNAERDYIDLLDLGESPQQARSVLPNSLKTEILMTANLREWQHILKLRTSKAAHPQMKELMCPLLFKLKKKLPIVFDDIKVT